jgi:hypothetical protein
MAFQNLVPCGLNGHPVEVSFQLREGLLNGGKEVVL